MSHNHNTSIRSSIGRAFLFGIILNTIYIIIEFSYGLNIRSMALIADAGHNLSDVLGLLLAWGAAVLATRSATAKRTFGLRKSTILAALFNALIIFTAVGAIIIEAIRKIIYPEQVLGNTMMMVAGMGVFINGVTAFLFMKDRKKDINIKGAFLHMAADAGVSLGVVAAGFIIVNTNLNWIDPFVSLLIVVVITFSTWGLLKEAFNLSIDAVPAGINTEEVKNYLEALPGVTQVHDLHIWAMSTTENSLTVHLVLEKPPADNLFLSGVCRQLHDKFGIEHTTVQLEQNKTLGSCTSSKV